MTVQEHAILRYRESFQKLTPRQATPVELVYDTSPPRSFVNPNPILLSERQKSYSMQPPLLPPDKAEALKPLEIEVEYYGR